ncbi:ATP-binding protein [Actinoplanes sp. KI2]|uniref:ATP-binding response regulator n=1 Tax=Actinoplanes sp. KI2 TaxID=2983315 RepID=UPI0021D5C486|nr:PAS domain-containing sensor histidine kinase [Actinoplanes sp. KI2]MCU7730110.1 ATP-binding protein [Actinoplanes sp. KI2]
MLSLASPPRALLFGTVALGPAVAAVAARPQIVLAVGGYALAVGAAVSSWQGLAGTGDQLGRLAVVAGATVISCVLARHQEVLRRRTARMLREQQLLAAVVEQSFDAIITSTLDGIVTSWNSGAELIYGYTAEQAIGRPVSFLRPAGREEAVNGALSELAKGRKMRFEDAPGLRSDGSALTLSILASPLRDEDGTVVAVAATERDMTAQKLALERSARAARLESVGQLAGGIAHDFNNLLAIILNYSDFLADEVSGPAADDLARIRDAAGRARSLISQLLTFAKREPTEVEIVDLNEVVAEADELLSRTIGANIRLVCRPDTGAVPVSANRGRLSQILLNLVVNARDAMPDGGTVVIETGIADLSEDEAGPLPPGRYARLTISDTGVGMTPEVRDRLFEPFFTTKPADQGTGLGLATVYGIVGDAGGHIGVASEPGAGTTFQILLPVANPASEEAGRAGAAPGERAPGHGELIAIIEDEDHVRDLVDRILRDDGYRTTAMRGEAIPDNLDDVALLVTDVMLSGRSGPSIAEELCGRHPGMRVLFMSGYSDTDLRRRYEIDAGIRIVQKPFTAVELLAGVAEALAPTDGPPPPDRTATTDAA